MLLGRRPLVLVSVQRLMDCASSLGLEVEGVSLPPRSHYCSTTPRPSRPGALDNLGPKYRGNARQHQG